MAAAGGDQWFYLHFFLVVKKATGGHDFSNLGVKIALDPVTDPPGKIRDPFNPVAGQPVGVLDPLRDLGGAHDESLRGHPFDETLK